jgi:fermentation-respiration switch protein FrsA (DUF1100 family)
LPDDFFDYGDRTMSLVMRSENRVERFEDETAGPARTPEGDPSNYFTIVYDPWQHPGENGLRGEFSVHDQVNVRESAIQPGFCIRPGNRNDENPAHSKGLDIILWANAHAVSFGIGQMPSSRRILARWYSTVLGLR